MKNLLAIEAAVLILCPIFGLGAGTWIYPPFPLEPRSLEVVPALECTAEENILDQLERDVELAGNNYDKAVSRYGWDSPEARAAASDFEAAYEIYLTGRKPSGK